MYIKKILFAISIIGVFAAAAFSYYIYNNIFSPNTAFSNSEAHVFISSSDTFEDVLSEIEPLLLDVETFIRVAKKKQYVSNIKPGHYILKKDMNNNDIINAIRSNNKPIRIKFNNQERIENLAGRIANQIEADSISLLKAMTAVDFLTNNGLDEKNALTIYIPNSYDVYWNTSAEAFCEKMYTEYKSFWNDSRKKKAASLGLSEEEVIVLASIVQKETAKADERPRVAGVYINRLKRGMLLQADPTVIYAKKLLDNDFNQEIKRVLFRDLELDSKYNTYKYSGLPPGPITMPDISSIDGVLNFEKHDYLFFVANVTDFGYHKFAKTLAQHNRNKQEYIRWINKQGVNR